MLVILLFFTIHWFLSLFFHSFFLHRYATHQMFTVSKGWEKTFYIATWLLQGSSFLVPRAYAILHRMHHEYSDTKEDPHSPHFFKDVWQMMKNTHFLFRSLVKKQYNIDPQFTKEYLPVWDSLDKFGNHILTRIVFALIYISIYVVFAPNYWFFLLLPIHFFMGAVQGAIVNWCGHKYGYTNYDNHDCSKNSSPWGIMLMGELFQNNHHFDKQDANFAKKSFEFDLTYLIMKVLDKVQIISLIRRPAV
ncbi:MAG: fatty acid desaturase [Chitinophagaceae bacterium]|nr:fatty acid desaturase [Chitinophagaceae bacterium]